MAFSQQSAEVQDSKLNRTPARKACFRLFLPFRWSEQLPAKSDSGDENYTPTFQAEGPGWG